MLNILENCKDSLSVSEVPSELQSSSFQEDNINEEDSINLSDVPSDIIIKSRIKYGSRWSAYKGIIIEYSKHTTIHGLRYIFEVHRPLYEK